MVSKANCVKSISILKKADSCVEYTTFCLMWKDATLFLTHVQKKLTQMKELYD